MTPITLPLYDDLQEAVSWTIRTALESAQGDAHNCSMLFILALENIVFAWIDSVTLQITH